MESRMRALGLGDVGGVEGLCKEEIGLLDLDNSVVITGGRGYKGAKWKWEKDNKSFLKKDNLLFNNSSLDCRHPFHREWQILGHLHGL